MSSVICQNFVQNAWKKELCSNCFKSKDEHLERPKPKPITLISNDNIEGIIRSRHKTRTKRSVCFTKELTEVIGFGGEHWDSEDEHNDEDSSEDEIVIESEEECDKELKRITKENTDFNTTNLKLANEKKSTQLQLQLGKPVVDSTGRKQTLMVQVTPFGEEPSNPKRFISISKNKESVPETKQSNVVLTSYTRNEQEKSLLDEINETLENSKNPIQIISRKKVQKEIVLSNKENDEPKPNNERKVALSRTPALKSQEKPVIYQTSTAKIELMNNKNKEILSQSREQAGEPDGKADDSIIEPPALPLTPPPPLETQNSFLHTKQAIYDKPKVPVKPVLAKKPPIEDTKMLLCKQDSSDSVRNKRRAPKPPEELFTRNSLNLNNESPVMREKEKRERATLSVSTDCLVVDKTKGKGRFSLRKFLRIGSSKDLRSEDIQDGPPLPKPRLVIVHPSDLNGERVEVVAKTKDEQNYENCVIKSKPQPPPRNIDSKPLPHPPKSSEIVEKQKQFGEKIEKKTETVYANIGEVRSAIVPNKPQRTASMREESKRMNFEENVYDYINSGSESDSSRHKNSPKKLNKRSESSIDVSGDYFKYSNIPRSLSLTYCGSETESEIYSPYTLCGSESEADDDWMHNRTYKLRSRKGRSIVHKNLEDNYGAVIVANHEALAQVLENIQQTNHIQPALRGLKSLSSLRWTDFSVMSLSQPVTVGSRTFHHAIWNNQHVTLVISTGVAPSSTLALGTYALVPITEFSDLIPEKYFNGCENEEKLLQGSVMVLPWLQITTIEAYSDSLKLRGTHEEIWRDASFIMLQLVNALKVLQAQGIEELSLSLNSFVLCKDMDKEGHYRLCVLPGLGEDVHSAPTPSSHGTLCACASRALSHLQTPDSRLSPLLRSLLDNERAVTLTQVKSVLEFCLWGPSDVALGCSVRDRELALQRWLDLQRATVLHGLVCARVQLTVYEECHLLFLVRSNARMMCDASLLLDSANKNGSGKARTHS